MGLTRKRLLLAASESSYGTSSNPIGTDAVLVEDDLKITPLEADSVERKLVQPYFGTRRKILVNQRVKVDFSVELVGSGAAGVAPRFGRLLKACGMAETVTASTSVAYGLLTDNSAIGSVSLAFHADGQKHLVTGCRGNVKLSGKLAEFPVLMFEFTGIYSPVVDAAIPTPTFANQATPVVFTQGNTTNLSINGWGNACLSDFELDLKNSVVYRALVGCTKQVRITDRMAEGKLTIEAPALADHDFFADANASAVGAISLQHGTTAGNICSISVPNANLYAPQYSDKDGIMMLDISFGMLPSSAGNDELALTFT